MTERMTPNTTGAVSPCPSCHGLNTSCPEGCGRDPLTGELNGTTLVSPNPSVVEAVARIEQEIAFQSVPPRGICGTVRLDDLRTILAALNKDQAAQ